MVNDSAKPTHCAELPIVQVPRRYNYVAVFLTMSCNLRCPFCINAFGGAKRRHIARPGDYWVSALNRLALRSDLPITLQGGEPSCHPDFLKIISGIREQVAIDILTNLQFDVDEFMNRIPAGRIRRDAPYASIRVSYHPQVMELQPLVQKVQRMLERGYSVGIWAVQHPEHVPQIEQARELCLELGIDFRTKEFLGMHGGRLFGTYKFPEAVAGPGKAAVECRTSELIVGPSGQIYRCHSDLYQGRAGIGEIGDPELAIEDVYRRCDCYGLCNPCDVKVKTNRFQQFGHTSVEIRPLPDARAVPVEGAGHV